MATPFTTYKLIILFLLQNTDNTLTNSQISEFILGKEYTNYFQLQQAISELVESDLLEMKTSGNVSHYRITEEGTLTLSYFENEISAEIKEEALEFLRTIGYIEPEKILTPADSYLAPNGRWNVRCQIIEKNVSLLDLTLTAPNEEAAREISQNWSRRYENVYEKIMEELL